jgi:thiol-disulfide isomerase/thioredoxin
MKCINKLFYLALIFALAISSIHAVPKETEESRKLKAESADRHIRFISPAEFSVHINKGLWIIMFGANWCKYTQRLTPKWLGLQTRIRAENLAKDINIAKVECNKDNNMDFCTSQGVDGFPTIYVYENGKKYEEYLGNHEVNEMFTYVQEQVARFKSEEVVEEVVTVYVEEVVYAQEAEDNKPRKSSKDEAQEHQEEEKPKPKPQAKQIPHQRKQEDKNKQQKPRVKDNNNHRKRERDNDNKVKTKQPPKAAPPKYAPPKYAPPKYDQKMPPKYGQNFPPKNYQRPPYPPKRPNVVVKATKKVFGLVESLITLAIILVVIYIIVRFRAIKSHSSYSKSKIPLYRDLTQEEKFMLHYS